MSFYPLTDDEQELRRRAWRFLMPAYERSWFERQIAELARNRILPVWLQPRDRAIYFRALMRDSGPSPASRYRRVSEDAVADAKLIDAFAITAARVVQADEARIKSLAWTADLAAGEVREAAARVAENRCLIAWVRFEVEVRRESYRYALEHLFIEAPQPEGAAVERTLAKLDAHRSAIDTLPGGPWEVSSCGLPPTAIARLAAVEPIAIVAKD